MPLFQFSVKRASSILRYRIFTEFGKNSGYPSHELFPCSYRIYWSIRNC